jgi:hypothetical protein
MIIDEKSRVIANNNKAELLEIKHKIKINKRINALEKEVVQIRRDINAIMEDHSLVI